MTSARPGSGSATASALSIRTLSWLDYRPAQVGILLALLSVAMFPTVWLGWHSFFYRDYGVLGYPFVFQARESFWRGEFPFWNSLSNCGAPFMAQWGTMTLYPFSLLCFLFPLPWSLSYFSLGHLWVGGMGTYFLARRWTNDPFAAAMAAVAYLYNGATFSCLLWPNYTVALAWMPWIIWSAEQAWKKRNIRNIVGASWVAAFQLLSGVPELVLLTWLLAGTLMLRDFVGARNERGRLLLSFGAIVVLAGALVAVQLGPFLDLLLHSQRDRSFATAKWPMPGWGWANFLVPLFHNFQTPQGPFFQYGQQFFSSYYLGAGVLVVAIWTAWRVRSSTVWILGGAFLLSIIMALGDNAFIFTWFRKVFPIAGIARYPIKFITIAAFAIPLLFAFGLAHWRQAPESRWPRSLLWMGAGALLLIGWILFIAHRDPFPYDQWDVTWKSGVSRAAFLIGIITTVILVGRHRGRRAAGWWQLVLIALVFLDARTHTANQNPTLPTEVFAPGLWNQYSQLPAPRWGIDRAYITPEAEARLLNSTVEDFHADFLGKRLALWSNLNLLEQIPKINGSSTLQLREQARVQKLIYDATNSTPEGLLDFLGASMQSAPGNPTEWLARTNPMPLITGGQRPIFAAAAETLNALENPDFNARNVVYLPAEARAQLGEFEPSAVRVLRQEIAAHSLVVEVEASQPALLVAAQSFYHPWKVTLDGDRPLRMWRANYAFQAVAIPAGRHVVRWKYYDRWFYLGLGISGLAWICSIGAWFWLARISHRLFPRRAVVRNPG